MVDDLGLGVDVGSIAGSAVDGLVMTIFWIIIGVVLVGAAAFILWLMSYKHRVRVRKVFSNGRSMIIDDKARVIKGNDGSVWWKTLKTGIKTTEPPVEAREIGFKGKTYVEGYLLSDGKFVWRNNDFDYEHLKSSEASSIKGGYDALTSDERAMFVSELKDSAQYKKKKLADLLAIAAPYIAIIMIFALFLIFFGEVVTPANEMGQQLSAASADIKEAMQIVKDVVENRETLRLQQNVTGGAVPN